MPGKNVSVFLRLLEHFMALPRNHADFICPVNQHLITDGILKIFVVPYRFRRLHLLVEEIGATEENLVSQVVNDQIPKGTNRATITANGQHFERFLEVWVAF